MTAIRLPSRTRDSRSRIAFFICLVAVVAVLAPSRAHADSITLDSTSAITQFSFTGGTLEWLLIGTASKDEGGTTVSVSGLELGAHLPLDGAAPTDGGGQGGGLTGVTQPTGALDPAISIGMNGDTALTDPTGTFNFQTIDGDGLLNGTTGRSGVYGDTGVQCSQTTGVCTDGNSNTYYDATGTFPMPDTLLSSSNGIVAGDGDTFEALRTELGLYSLNIPLLPSSGTLDGGTFTEDLIINLLSSGLYVLDVESGDDWNLNDFDIVINGLATSYLIIRIPDGVNMLTANSWIGIGDGIGLTNVLFYTAQDDNDTHFSFQNTVFNGVSFWDLSGTGSKLSVSNGQGCTQFIADTISLSNVRLNNCGFSGESFDEPGAPVVPEPSSLILLGTGLAAAAGRWHRRRGRGAGRS